MKTKWFLLLATLLAILNLSPQVAQGAAPVITSQPQSVFAAEGGSASFAVMATGELLTYQWFHQPPGVPGPMPLHDATNATLLLTNLQVTAEGSYQVLVSNPFGSMPSDPAALVVKQRATRVLLFCRDGKPITNCTLTITLTNEFGHSDPKIANSPIGNLGDDWFWTCFNCPGGLDPSAQWWFQVTASCCTNVWTIPTTKCYGDFYNLICDSCGDCPVPQIVCPPSVNLLSACFEACVPYSYPSPAVVSGTLAGCTPPAGYCFPIGATTVTCVATNQCGDTNSCQFTVTVKPCLVCPTDKTVICDGPFAPWDFDPPTVEPGCAPIQIGVLSTTTNGVCPQIITRTWSVSGDCGNGLGFVTQCQQSITVVDIGSPILHCELDKSVPCFGDFSFDPPTYLYDGCNEVTLQVVSTVTNFPCTAFAYIVRTWMASDICGNVTQCSQTIYQDQSLPGCGCDIDPCCPPCPVPFPASFSITVNPGLNYLVNPLCHGNMNTVGVILANVPDQTGLSIWDKTTASYITDLFDVNLGGWSNPNQPLPPGMGFILNNPGPAYVLTFVGCEPLCPPRCPPTNEICLVGNTGSAPGTSTWESLFGTNCPPICGSTVSIYNPLTGGYDDYVFLNGAWSPSTPSWPNGTSVFVSWKANTNCLPCEPTLAYKLNTGTTPSGALLPTGAPEQNWVNIAAPGGPLPMIVANPTAYPIVSGPWVGPNSVSAWVTPNANTQGPLGFYTNRWTFEADCTNVCLRGRFATDDDGYLYVNGVLVAGGSGFTAWTSVNVCSGFNLGLNTIELVVNNAASYTGFRTELEVWTQCCACSCTFTNGDFEIPVPTNATGGGWTSSDNFAGDGWQASGGNPGGTFLLNNVGDPNTDPTISQKLCCLTPGQCYTIHGQRKVQQWYGQTQPSFAVLLDGNPILVLAVPSNPADGNWYDFSVSFAATNACQTISFASEYNGTDVSYYLDNIWLECCKPHCEVTLRCPDDTNVVACAVVGGVTPVTYTVPTATSTCPGPVNVVCVPPSGGLFPIGATLVTCTATDAQGNTASCSFSVIVTAPPPWTVKCPPLNLSVTGCPPVMPDLSSLITIMTNCAVPCPITITQDIPAGTILPPGQHTVIIRTCDCTGVCYDCDVIVTAVYPNGCCAQPCTPTPVLSLFSGTDANGPLAGGAQDPQFLTGAPLFSTASPYVPFPIHWLWLPNDANSQWIGPVPNFTGSPVGEYIFTNRFFLCSTQQASLTGRWAGDDSGEVWLNGVPTGNVLPNGWAFLNWTPISITSGLQPGWNELTFRITNSLGGSVTGMRVELTGRACCNPCVYITCPGNIVTNTCSTGANVSWIMPLGVGSHCGTLQSVTCVPPSGSNFPVGTTTVNCTATDSCGNAANCSFTVTVNSIAPPCVLKCPPNQTLYTCGNNAIAYYKAKAHCNGVPLICTPASGSVFPLGTNTVTCALGTPCGIVSCSFQIIVKRYPIVPPWWHWPCDTAVIANGIPKVPVNGARLAVMPPLELPAFGPIGNGPTVCLTAPPAGGSGSVAYQTGGGRSFVFTTILDMNAAEGATIEILQPNDPVPLLTLSKLCCGGGWDLKKCKGGISDRIGFQSTGISPEGELLGSFGQTLNEGNTNAALELKPEDATLTQFPVTLVFDHTDGSITVLFPGDLSARAGGPRRKGWDGTIKGFTSAAALQKGWDGKVKNHGTIKGNITINQARASAVTFVPFEPHAYDASTLTVRATGVDDVVLTGEQLGTLQADVGLVPDTATLFSSTVAGDDVRWLSLVGESGVDVNLGRSASFDVGFTGTPPAGLGDGSALEFRVRGVHPLALTNRPTIPVPLEYLRLEQSPDGVLCTVDFSYLAATEVTVRLFNHGALIGEGTGSGPAITADSPLIIDRWPDRFGVLDHGGVLRLTTSTEFIVSGISGDELHFIPTLPGGAAGAPVFYTGLECLAGEGLDALLRNLQRTTACTPTALSLVRGSGGIVITWPGDGYHLQGAEHVTGPWFNLGVTSPVSLSSQAPHRYFRLVCD